MKKINYQLLLFIVCWSVGCAGLSGTYFYELYLHNEYYNEPPGFPNKIILYPFISSFSGSGPDWKEKRFAGGLIGSLRLDHNHTWIEFIAALGKERVEYNHAGVMGKASHFGGDDFLIDIGHNFLDATGKKQLLVHWLTGIPLTKKVRMAEIEAPLWGTRSVATGPVIELAYDFIRTEAQDFFIGVINRFLHRFKQHYEPILPSTAFFNAGNAIDIVGLMHYRYYGQNFEVGYVFSRYWNISYQFTDHTEHLPSERYNSFYFDYFYFYEKLSLGFECNITKTYGKPYEGITVFGGISWYF